MPKKNEFEIISSLFAPMAGEGSFEFKDDAAELKVPEGFCLVVTQDAIAEGIHFFPTDAADLIARKALRVNLSDLAAKGASLHSFSLSIGLGESVDDQWLETFAAGLQSDCKEYGISLSGGDTFKTGNTTVISITAFGLVPEGDYVSRLGTSVGDGLFVTGTIGDAALGLSILWGDIALNSEKDSLKLIERYHLPQPRVDQASLIRSFATASMDISDGLVGDMEKLCSASNVGAEITVEDVPLSDSAQSVISENPQLLETALTGGDDYEILFTVSQDKLSDFQKVAAKTNLSITQIGRISSGSQVVVLDGEGNSLSFQQPSYIHRS